MFKRIILGLVVVATFALGSLATPQSADAWRWGRPYRTYYYGPPSYATYYGPYGAPYRTYYRTYYGPRYYDPYYSRYYYDSPRVYVGYGNGGVIVR
jgi:hypothetical protein